MKCLCCACGAASQVHPQQDGDVADHNGRGAGRLQYELEGRDLRKNKGIHSICFIVDQSLAFLSHI